MSINNSMSCPSGMRKKYFENLAVGWNTCNFPSHNDTLTNAIIKTFNSLIITSIMEKTPHLFADNCQLVKLMDYIIPGRRNFSVNNKTEILEFDADVNAITNDSSFKFNYLTFYKSHDTYYQLWCKGTHLMTIVIKEPFIPEGYSKHYYLFSLWQFEWGLLKHGLFQEDIPQNQYS